MKQYSLRRRLVVAMVAALAAALSAIAIFLYIGVRDAAWQQHDDALLARARALSALAEHDDEGYEFEAPALKDAYVELFLPDGKVVRPGPALLSRGLVKSGDDRIHLELPASNYFFDLDLPDGERGRAVALTFVPRDEVGTAKQVTLIVADGIASVTKAVAAIRNLFILVSLIALVLIAAVVSWITGRALRPLDALGRELEHIDDRSLAHRLPTANQPLELAAPVTKLNQLLARLATSFARERRFTADVSHELRTPVAGLRTLLEVTSLADRSTPEYKQAVADAHSIVLQLGALIENLLMLARLDADQLSITPTDVDLHELVAQCWAPHAAAAAVRDLTFDNRMPAGTVHVDREKLRVILGNLLSNAAEYTEAGGWITVTDEGGLVTVADSGPPLPDETKIFDRLWRGDASRTSAAGSTTSTASAPTPGVHCGIGLSLGRSLAEHMQLALRAENRPDGSVRFTIARA